MGFFIRKVQQELQGLQAVRLGACRAPARPLAGVDFDSEPRLRERSPVPLQWQSRGCLRVAACRDLYAESVVARASLSIRVDMATHGTSCVDQCRRSTRQRRFELHASIAAAVQGDARKLHHGMLKSHQDVSCRKAR